MQLINTIREQLSEAWIPNIYVQKVRSVRTRSHHLDIPERENRSEIMFTLLGIELKVGNKRFACPDLSTARYLQVFARLGCSNVAVPYDITQISPVADELETAWQRMLLVIANECDGVPAQTLGKTRATIIRQIRQEIAKIGAGELMPEFKRSTKQRS
jgi:hypothetical protein